MSLSQQPFKAVALAGLTALALVFTAPGPASAAPDADDGAQVMALSGPHHWMYTDDSTPGGRIDFWPNGDHFKLCDIQADGWSTYAFITDYNGKEISLKASGNGTCATSHGSQGGNHNLVEGRCYHVVIGLSSRAKGVDHNAQDSAWWLNDNYFKVNC